MNASPDDEIDAESRARLDYESRIQPSPVQPAPGSPQSIVPPLRALLLTGVAALVIILLIYGFDALVGHIREERARARATEHFRKARICKERMATVGDAITEYASRHNGQLPNSLLDLLDQGYLDTADLLLCPERKDVLSQRPAESQPSDCEVVGSYCYLGRGLSAGGPAATPILVHREANHFQDPLVLWLDGTVTTCSDADTMRLLRQQCSALGSGQKN